MLWLDAVSINASVKWPCTRVGMVHTRSTKAAGGVLVDAAHFAVGGMHINGVYMSECHMGLLGLWEWDCNVACQTVKIIQRLVICHQER